MSRFSGKCDVYDWCEKYADDELKNVKFFIGDTRISINCRYDLIPYYPYIVWMGASSRDGNDTIFMSEESWVDTMERNIVGMYMDNVKNIYNKCQRDGTDFYVNETRKHLYGMCNDIEMIDEIFYRVKVDGNNAKPDGIRSKIYNFYREELLREMIKAGYASHVARTLAYKNV